MKRLVVGMLMAAAGCGGPPKPQPIPEDDAARLMEQYKVPEAGPNASDVYPDWKQELLLWKRTVLDRSDLLTLGRLKEETVEVLRLLDTRIRETGRMHPYVAAEYRKTLRERARHESERLRLIEERLAAFGPSR